MERSSVIGNLLILVLLVRVARARLRVGRSVPPMSYAYGVLPAQVRLTCYHPLRSPRAARLAPTERLVQPHSTPIVEAARVKSRCARDETQAQRDLLQDFG